MSFPRIARRFLVVLILVSLAAGDSLISGCCPPWGDCDPSCRLSTTNLVFGSIDVGSQRDLTFRIENTGGGTLSGSVSINSTDFSIVDGGGSFALEQSQGRVVTVRFSPLSPGAKMCTIDLGTGVCSEVSCTGNATQSTVCEVSPATLDFGSVPTGSHKDLSFEITNAGAGTLYGRVTESCEEFSIVSGGGTYSLDSNQTRTVTVRYAPKVPGSKECWINTGTILCTNVKCTAGIVR